MRKKYEKKFKEMIVSLLESGQTSTQVGLDYQLNPTMINRWRRESQGPKKAFTGNGVASLTDQERELVQLRNKLKDTQLERDILKKAISIFSKSDRPNMNS